MDQHVIDYLNNKKEWEAFLAKLNEFSISEAKLEKLADEGCKTNY
jgi:hypothetical protein